jgi:hypothetical protein
LAVGLFFCLLPQKICATQTRKPAGFRVVLNRMGIEYTTTPHSFEELCDSVRGQVERSRELRMMGETIPYEESVELTSESMLELLDRIEQLSEIANTQALLFTQINEIFKWIFNYVGIDIENVIFEGQLDESEEG